MLVLKIKEKSFIYSRHKNIYQPLFISILRLSGSAGVEAELHPDYRNHSRRSPQLTTYTFASSQHLTAKVPEGLITNRERIAQISVFTTFISVAAEPRERERYHELPKSSYRSVQISLGRCKTAFRMYQDPTPPGSDRGTSMRLIHPRVIITPTAGDGGVTRAGWMPPPTRTESGQRVPWRLHTFSSLPSPQCALCFLFLCFLSFFLLAHLEQNHCISSGGAAVIPTQGLGRTGKYRIISAE